MANLDGRPKTFSGLRASQMTEELNALLHLAKSPTIEASSYLEIGARHGDTFHAVMSAMPPGSRGLAVDMPGGAWGQRNSHECLERAVADLQRRGYVVSAIFGDSQQDDTANKVAAWRNLWLGGRKFDLSLIDGDHRFEGVSRDFKLYAPMTRFVALHDIVGDGQHDRDRNPVEVPRFWREVVRANFIACIEIVAHNSKMGLGVVDMDAFIGGQS